MKKLYCLIIILLTGCANHAEKLQCSILEKTKDYSIYEIITFEFDQEGTQIQNGIYNLELEVKDDYIDYLNKFKGTIVLEYTNLYDIGVKRKLVSKNNTLNFVLSYNASMYSKAEKDKLLNHSLYFYGNYNEVKKELEKDGYKCN